MLTKIKPYSLSVKPRFKVKPSNTTAYEGYPVMIHCIAIGDPNPTINWDKNGNVNGFNPSRFKVSCLINYLAHLAKL